MLGCSGKLLGCWLLFFLSGWTVHVYAECNRTEFPNTYVDGGNPVSKMKPDLPHKDNCTEECERTNGCTAVSYDSSNFFAPCTIFTSSNPPQNRAQSSDDYSHRTFIEVSCVAECKLTERNGRGVTSTPDMDATLTASLDSCQRLCTWLIECTAVSYNGTCIIHTSAVTSSTSEGFVFAERKTCSNFTNCCFDAPKLSTKGTSSSMMSVQATLKSCQGVCKAIRSCGFVAFDGGNVCKVFKSQPITMERPGSKYFRSCDNISARGSLRVYTQCRSTGETIRLSKLLGIWLVMLFVALV